MRNITTFNKTIQGLINDFPNWEATIVLQKYMEKFGEINYHNALNNIGIKLGIEFLVIESTNPKTGNITGYRPAIQYQAGNPENGKARLKKFMDSPFNSSTRCYEYLARQYFYTLQDVPMLSKHVFGEVFAE